MEVRDAVEADAPRLASLTDAPEDVMRNLVHDRTVRVAYDPDVASEDGDDPAAAAILGFVSFDARQRTVHVTQLEGEAETYDRLLAEPLQFAETEGMAVELLVPEDETNLADAAEAAGFEARGSGPRFDGRPTVRYRLDA